MKYLSDLTLLREQKDKVRFNADEKNKAINDLVNRRESSRCEGETKSLIDRTSAD